MICTSVVAVLHLVSAHTGTYDYNNRNYGAGLECRGEVYSVQAGTYRNSYDRQSWYVVGGLELGGYRAGDAEFTAGLTLGPVSGYGHRQAPVMGGLRLTARWRPLEAAVLAVPGLDGSDSVVHLMLGVAL